MQVDFKSKKFYIFLGVLLFVVIGALIYLENILGGIFGFLKILTPLFLGVLFALILNLPYGLFNDKVFKIQNRKSEFAKKSLKMLSLFLTYIVFIGLIVFVILILIPQLIDSMTLLFNKLPKALDGISNNAENFLGNFNVDKEVFLNVKEQVIGYVNTLLTNLVESLPNIFSKLSIYFSKIITFIMSLVFSGYLLFHKEKMKDNFLKIVSVFGKKRNEQAKEILDVSTTQFNNFFSGQFLEGIILGLLCFVGMLILEIPYAPLVSTIIAITSLIPMLGVIIGSVPSVLIIMIDNPKKALVFLTFFLLLQIIEGNFIYPRVVGGKINLPGFYVLLGVVVGSGLFGIVGIFLAVPVCSIIYNLISNKMRNRKKKKEDEESRKNTKFTMEDSEDKANRSLTLYKRE